MSDDVMRGELVETLEYRPETGDFFWKNPKSNRVKVGQKAGCLNAYGYVVIFFKGKLRQASHLAWLYVYGVLPKELDHINHTPADNRISNLRLCSRSENQSNRRKQSNNTSGFKGIHWFPQSRKWRVRLGHKGKHYHVGLFNTIEEAVAAYDEAVRRLHKEYAYLQAGGVP